MSQRMRPQTATRRQSKPHGEADASLQGADTSNQSKSDRMPRIKQRPQSALATTSRQTSGGTAPAPRVSSASKLRTQAETERQNAATRPPSGLSKETHSARSQSPGPDDLEDIARRGGNLWMGQLLTLLKSINKWPLSLDATATCKRLRMKAAALVQAESAAIFLVDDGNTQVVLQSSNSPFCRDQTASWEETIRVPFGKGIVGTVAASGQPLASSDVRAEPLYDGEYDAYASLNGRIDVPPTNVLCVPWFDSGGAMVAVLQVVNKRSGLPFTTQDENMLQLLGFKATTVLQCCDIHMRTMRDEQNKRSEAQGDRSHRLAQALTALNEVSSEREDDIVSAAAEQLESLVSADFCSVFLLDDAKQTLWSTSVDPAGQGERIELEPSKETTSGYAFQSGQVLNVPNVYQDVRFNEALAGGVVDDDLDELLNPDKCGVCCVPLSHPLDVACAAPGVDPTAADKTEGGERESVRVFGVVEVMKRVGVSDDEQQLLEEFCKQLAQKLFTAQSKIRREQTMLRCSSIASSSSREQAIRRARRAFACLGSVHVGIVMRDAVTDEFLTVSPQGDRVRAAASGLCGYSARTQQTLNLTDVRGAVTKDGTEFNPAVDSAGCKDAVSFLCAPMVATDENKQNVCIGVIFAANKSIVGGAHEDITLRFDRSDEEHAGLIADHLVQALDRCRTHDEDAEMKAGCEEILRTAPQLLSEFDIRRLLKVVSQDMCSVLGADHCTPYMVDAATGEIWTKAEGLRREVRLPKGQGVAGAVALSGKLVRVKDGEEAKKVLGEASDKLTGGVVKSMLCCGVVGSRGDIIAVLQAFHSQSRAFSKVHEQLMQVYSRLFSVAIENQALLVKHNRDVLQGLPVDWEREKVHKCLSRSIENQIDCEKVVIFELVSPWDRLRCHIKPGTVEDFPVTKGVVGSVFTSGNSVMTEHPKLLPLFDPECDQPTKKDARTMLCVPMYDTTSSCVGVALALNKRKIAFTRQDEATLKALCIQFGEILSSRQKHENAQTSIQLQSFFLDANKGLSGYTDLRSMMATLNKYTMQLFHCHATTVLKFDKENGKLFTFDADGGELRIPVSSTTVAGFACLSGEAIRVEDVFKDSRFNKYYSRAENAQHKSANMLCCPVKKNADVLAAVQCIRYDGEKFSLDDENKMVEYAKQVVMPAFNAHHQNRPAYRIFSLVDDFCTLSAEVKSKGVLTSNIKKVVRKALACEKVNLYTVDVMRQELVSDIASSYDEEIEFLEEQVNATTSRVRGTAGADGEHISKMFNEHSARLNQALQQRDRLAGSCHRFSFGLGVVGKVAETGGFRNVQDATGEEVVDCEQYSIQGLAAKTMLCQCAYNAAGDMVGVIQAVNKRHGVFTQEDEFLLERLSGQAGVMLYHAEVLGVLDKSSKARFKLCEFAVNVVECVDDIGVINLMEQHGRELLGTRTCTLWVHDAMRKTMWTLADGEIKSVKIRELSTSVVGRAAISGEVEIQIFDTDGEDQKHAQDGTAQDADQEQENKSQPSKILSDVAFRSCAMGQPVLGKKSVKELLGVIECHNKRGGVFDEEDKYVMELLGTITAGALQHIRDGSKQFKSFKSQQRRLSVEGF